MVIEQAPLEDELGDVLDKARQNTGMTERALAERAGVDAGKIRDAVDYRYDLSPEEIGRLCAALQLNEVGVRALAAGRYPLPEISGLPFCVYPLRMPHGIGVANAYIVAECGKPNGVLFDAGTDAARLRRVWPAVITKLDAVFLTHAETEHIGGLEDVMRQFGPVPVFGPAGSRVRSAVALGEGGRVEAGGFSVETLATPGHAEAHNCYVVRNPRVARGAALLISGDLLFAGSVGGAYFCEKRQREHLSRVLALDETTVVAPGHGPLTTLKNERTFNPFVV